MAPNESKDSSLHSWIFLPNIRPQPQIKHTFPKHHQPLFEFVICLATVYASENNEPWHLFKRKDGGFVNNPGKQNHTLFLWSNAQKRGTGVAIGRTASMNLILLMLEAFGKACTPQRDALYSVICAATFLFELLRNISSLFDTQQH